MVPWLDHLWEPLLAVLLVPLWDFGLGFWWGSVKLDFDFVPLWVLLLESW